MLELSEWSVLIVFVITNREHFYGLTVIVQTRFSRIQYLVSVTSVLSKAGRQKQAEEASSSGNLDQQLVEQQPKEQQQHSHHHHICRTRRQKLLQSCENVEPSTSASISPEDCDEKSLPTLLHSPVKTTCVVVPRVKYDYVPISLLPMHVQQLILEYLPLKLVPTFLHTLFLHITFKFDLQRTRAQRGCLPSMVSVAAPFVVYEADAVHS